MDGRCEKHGFEVAVARCRECVGEYCAECLVYPFGDRKPPLCIACAIAVAGVRSTAGRPQRASRRDVRREEKQRRKAAKAAAKSGGSPFGDDPFGSGGGASGTDVGAPVPLVTFELQIGDDGTVRKAS